LQLRFAEGELTVIARTQDVGESARVDAGLRSRERRSEIGFTLNFLRDGLESMDGDERCA